MAATNLWPTRFTSTLDSIQASRVTNKKVVIFRSTGDYNQSLNKKMHELFFLQLAQNFQVNLYDVSNLKELEKICDELIIKHTYFDIAAILAHGYTNLLSIGSDLIDSVPLESRCNWSLDSSGNESEIKTKSNQKIRKFAQYIKSVLHKDGQIILASCNVGQSFANSIFELTKRTVISPTEGFTYFTYNYLLRDVLPILINGENILFIKPGSREKKSLMQFNYTTYDKELTHLYWEFYEKPIEEFCYACGDWLDKNGRLNEAIYWLNIAAARKHKLAIERLKEISEAITKFEEVNTPQVDIVNRSENRLKMAVILLSQLVIKFKKVDLFKHNTMKNVIFPYLPQKCFLIHFFLQLASDYLKDKITTKELNEMIYKLINENDRIRNARTIQNGRDCCDGLELTIDEIHEQCKWAIREFHSKVLEFYDDVHSGKITADKEITSFSEKFYYGNDHIEPGKYYESEKLVEAAILCEYSLLCGCSLSTNNAIIFYQRAASQGSEIAAFNLACIYKKQGDQQKASEWSQKAGKLSDLLDSPSEDAEDDTETLIKNAVTAAQDERIGDAIFYYEKAASLGSAEAAMNLYRIYYALGDENKALKWSQKAGELSVLLEDLRYDETETLIKKAVTAAQDERIEDAIFYYERAASLGSAEAATNLYRIYYAQGDEKKASEWSQKAKELSHLLDSPKDSVAISPPGADAEQELQSLSSHERLAAAKIAQQPKASHARRIQDLNHFRNSCVLMATAIMMTILPPLADSLVG